MLTRKIGDFNGGGVTVRTEKEKMLGRRGQREGCQAVSILGHG